MADYKVLIPKLGESVQEGTVTKLLVKLGDIVKEARARVVLGSS